MNLECFEHSPITGIHLWFDREVSDLEHAILLDATIQWMFHKSKLQPEKRRGEPGSYLELVVSASKSLVSMQRQEIIDLALRELAQFFPLVAQAKLLKATVVKEVRATYSIRPQLELLRPSSASPWPRIFLAGDWVATGWPATMEGAVRSGYLAAEAVSQRSRRTGAFPATRSAGNRIDASADALAALLSYPHGRVKGNRSARTSYPAATGRPEPPRSTAQT